VDPFAPKQAIKLRLLGGASLDGAPDGDKLLAKTKRAALLVHLALAKPYDGYHRRDAIATLFWPEVDTASARSALRRSLHEVRQDLGEDAVLGRGDEELKLNRDLVWCDVLEMEAAVKADQFAHALELYRGPLLPGFYADAPAFEDWLDRERTTLRDLATKAALALAKQCEADQSVTVAVHWAKIAATMAYLDERVVTQVMELLVRAGARVEALRVYAKYAEQLKAAFDAEPSAPLKARAESLKAG
jgi:DNA-binding SARP family transcriptional activator